MVFFDWLFCNEQVITLLGSGGIGLLIYFSTGGTPDSNHNKYFYILLGLPIWLFIKGLYWFYRKKYFYKKIYKGDPNVQKEIDNLWKKNSKVASELKSILDYLLKNKTEVK